MHDHRPYLMPDHRFFHLLSFSMCFAPKIDDRDSALIELAGWLVEQQDEYPSWRKMKLPAELVLCVDCAEVPG